jgi:hypothetical protein
MDELEDQLLLLDVNDTVRPLPQSLPENRSGKPVVPLSYPTAPMPLSKPPSPPHTQSNSQDVSRNTKARIQNFKKKKRGQKFCMQVPSFFRTMMNPNSQSSIYHSSYITASGGGEDDDNEDSQSRGYSSWVEEDYGDIHSSQFYRNPNRGLGNSAQGAYIILGISMLQSYTKPWMNHC